jgi:hypothetical protein
VGVLALRAVAANAGVGGVDDDGGECARGRFRFSVEKWLVIRGSPCKYRVPGGVASGACRKAITTPSRSIASSMALEAKNIRFHFKTIMSGYVYLMSLSDCVLMSFRPETSFL